MKNDFESDEFNSNDNNNNYFESKLVDIRIVLTDLNYIEAISKAVSNFDLSNFNVNISSIIPSSDIEIAKNTIIGADLVLIATSSDFEGKELYSNFKRALKTDYNFVEYLKLPSLDELEDYDYDYDEDNTFEDEIANSIIRAGLYSISNLSSINKSKKAYYNVKKDFDDSRLRFEKITKENDILLNESKQIREKNEKLREEVKILQKDLDNIKSDYSDLKSRFESIHSKNSLEVFSLMELWQDLFNETFTEEIYRFILISTDNFRPKNLMIGQGAICAESKEDAMDWLKIIKTAFILSDTNKQELNFNNFNSNFKFEDLDSNISSSQNLDSTILSSQNLDSNISNTRYDLDSNDSNLFSSLDSNIFNEDNSDSSDEFIYNERFEGNNNSQEEFRQLDFDDAFDLNDNEGQESFNQNDLDNSYNPKDDPSDEINVFNLKSLKGFREESDEDESAEAGDYSYEEDDDLAGDDDLFNPFSNIWD